MDDTLPKNTKILTEEVNLYVKTARDITEASKDFSAALIFFSLQPDDFKPITNKFDKELYAQARKLIRLYSERLLDKSALDNDLNLLADFIDKLEENVELPLAQSEDEALSKTFIFHHLLENGLQYLQSYYHKSPNNLLTEENNPILLLGAIYGLTGAAKIARQYPFPSRIAILANITL